MQLSAMRAYAKRRGWSVATEVKEIGSGAKTRPQREEILKAARRRELDAIVVWRLDRWGRSLLDLIASLQELHAVGTSARGRNTHPVLRWPEQTADCRSTEDQPIVRKAATGIEVKS